MARCTDPGCGTKLQQFRRRAICTIAAGNYSGEISFSDTSGGPFQVNAAGTMAVPASAQQNSALSFTNDGPWGTSSESQGANAAGLTIGNTGSIALTQGQSNSINNYLFGLYSRMTGGNGYNGNPGSNQTLNGGSTAQLALTNSGGITIYTNRPKFRRLPGFARRLIGCGRDWR